MTRVASREVMVLVTVLCQETWTGYVKVTINEKKACVRAKSAILEGMHGGGIHFPRPFGYEAIDPADARGGISELIAGGNTVVHVKALSSAQMMSLALPLPSSGALFQKKSPTPLITATAHGSGPDMKPRNHTSKWAEPTTKCTLEMSRERN